MIQRHLTVNKFSRPGKPLKAVRGVVLHWTAKPMGTAEDVYNWFQGRAKGGPQYKGLEYGSTQYVIDFDGTIWEMIPPNEMAYHCGADKYTQAAKTLISNYPNDSSIGIEHCTKTWAGEYTPETVAASLVLRGVIAQKQRNPVYELTHDEIVLGGWDCPRNPAGLYHDRPYLSKVPIGIVDKIFYWGTGQKIVGPGQVSILDLNFSNNTILLASNCGIGTIWVPADAVKLGAE